MDLTTHTFDFTHDWISGYFETWERLIPVRPNLNILEIGCYEGRSTVWFLQRFPACHITCIDTFEGGQDHKELGLDFSDVERRFRHNTAPWEAQVILRKGLSAEWLRCMSTKLQFDLLLIDGSHLAPDVLTDIILSWPLLASGSIMICDDKLWGLDRMPHLRPQPAIEAFQDCFAGQFDVLEDGYQFLCRKL